MEVWKDKLDSKYDIVVTRTKPYKGLLRVSEGDTILLEEEVLLSYDAKFGPDAFDIEDWQNRVIKFIDSKPEREEGDS